MDMPVYRVTEKKVEEYLGESVKNYFNPLRGKGSLKFILSTGFITIIFLLMAALALWGFLVIKSMAGLWLFFFTILFMIIILIVLYKSQKAGHIDDCTKNIKDLVNDSQLLWLNTRKTAYPEHNKIKGRWSTSNKGKLVATTFEILAYLKKEGSSQGIHNKIKSLRSSASAKRVLKRLAEKVNFDQPILNYDGSDFKYVPWKFKLVDARGLVINTLEAEKLEEVLKTVWDKMIAEEGRRWG